MDWLLQPDFNKPEFDHATWYFDGSLLDGKTIILRATGFGIAIVSSEGDLLAMASGDPTALVQHRGRS